MTVPWAGVAVPSGAKGAYRAPSIGRSSTGNRLAAKSPVTVSYKSVSVLLLESWAAYTFVDFEVSVASEILARFKTNIGGCLIESARIPHTLSSRSSSPQYNVCDSGLLDGSLCNW